MYFMKMKNHVQVDSHPRHHQASYGIAQLEIFSFCTSHWLDGRFDFEALVGRETNNRNRVLHNLFGQNIFLQGPHIYILR